MIIERNENESITQLVKRICSQKKELGLTWDDISDILNELTGFNRTESYWRKNYKSGNEFPNTDYYGEYNYDTGYSDYNGSCKLSNDNDKYADYLTADNLTNDSIDNIDNKINELNNKIRELKIKEIQFRDERNAWNKQHYLLARQQKNFEILEDKLSSIYKEHFPDIDLKISNSAMSVMNSDKEMIVMLSDWHIGSDFRHPIFGEYNSNIAINRLNMLFNKVLEYKKLFNVRNIKIALLGDVISGSIHLTTQLGNRENLIEQVKIASTFVSEFCYKCCNEFEQVDFISVPGNHSRIVNNKEDALHDERLDILIEWIVGLSLKHIENFSVVEHVGLYDSGIGVLNVCGKDYVCVHGDLDFNNKSSALNLYNILNSNYCNVKPYAILRGHMHSSSFNDFNGIKVIQGGSLSGTGDQYTVEKRLLGTPCQTILICDKTGIISHMPVELY